MWDYGISSSEEERYRREVCGHSSHWHRSSLVSLSSIAVEKDIQLIVRYPPLYTFFTTGASIVPSSPHPFHSITGLQPYFGLALIAGIAGSVTTFSSWMIEGYMSFANLGNFPRSTFHSVSVDRPAGSSWVPMHRSAVQSGRNPIDRIQSDHQTNRRSSMASPIPSQHSLYPWHVSSGESTSHPFSLRYHHLAIDSPQKRQTGPALALKPRLPTKEMEILKHSGLCLFPLLFPLQLAIGVLCLETVDASPPGIFPPPHSLTA